MFSYVNETIEEVISFNEELKNFTAIKLDSWKL